MYNKITASFTRNQSQQNYSSCVTMASSISAEILGQTTSKWPLTLQMSLASIQFIISIICNLIMIGTLLQKKIRITSCGIYLLLFSLASLLAMSTFYIRTILTLYFNEELHRNSLIHCRLSMATTNCTQLIGLWSAAFVSVERVLIQCFDFSIYRSRRCSVITSLSLIGLTVAASITWFIGSRIVLHPIVPTIYMCAFSQLSWKWELVDKVITSIYIHVVIPWFLHTLSVFFTLAHIIRHKIIMNDVERLERTRIIWQQIKKHKDFFIPPIVIILCTMPHEILAYGYTKRPCTKSNIGLYFLLHMILDFLYFMPLTLGLFIYIYPSKVYWPFQRKRIPSLHKLDA